MQQKLKQDTQSLNLSVTSLRHQVHHDFQELIEYVIGKGSKSCIAYEVELSLFRQLLSLGAKLLQLFFVQRAAVRPSEPVSAPDGMRLEYHDRRSTTYFSVFGKVQFWRHYFHTSGHEGVCPLDAELSLPPRCYSDLLRDWAEYCATDESYDESILVIKRILGLTLSKRAMETDVQEDATDEAAFYEQKKTPSTEEESSILVVQADGKGVPMKHDKLAVKSARQGKGQKRTKKKEAVVTASYTVDPYQRTPQEVVEALLPELTKDKVDQRTSTSQAKPQRPVPVGKEVRATLDGKDVAFERLTQRVAQREGEHIHQRVALTDGAESLQDRVKSHLPEFALVLDIIHTSEYLWDTANAVLGEPISTAPLGWENSCCKSCLVNNGSYPNLAELGPRLVPIICPTPDAKHYHWLLPTQLTLHALRPISGARLAYWHRCH